MKKIVALFLTLLVLGGMVFAGGQQDGAAAQTASGDTYEKAKLRLINNGADTAPDSIAARMVAEKVKERSGGAIIIEVYSNDQLAGGNQTKGIEMLTQGIADFGVYSCITSGAVINEKIMTPILPFTFTDYQDATSYLTGTGGEFLKGVLAGHGLTLLGTVHNGFRQFSNNKRPVITPADMKNLKIRVPGNDMFLAIWKALGADPIAMSWGEVYTALQQGTIDGQDNGFKTSASTKMYEVQKHFSRVNYMYDAFLFTSYTDSFKKLPMKSQELIREAIAEACVAVNKSVEDEEEQLVEMFRSKHGVTISELTPDQINAFRNLIKPVIDKYKAQFGAEACAAFGIR